MFEELAAGGGEADVAAETIEETALEVLFEGLDGVADSGLGEMKFAGGVREAADAGESGEGEELTAVENGRHTVVPRAVVAGASQQVPSQWGSRSGEDAGKFFMGSGGRAHS